MFVFPKYLTDINPFSSPLSAPSHRPLQCLGGMAQGPCGEDFKSAFSCFVHSDQEPKGVDCVEKFKAMQDCFRKHPDVYGEGQSLGFRR
jgi:intermembrane space import and assembly protein 40